MNPIIEGFNFSDSCRVFAANQIFSSTATAGYLQLLEEFRFQYFSSTYGGLSQSSALFDLCDIKCLHGDGLYRN